MHFCQEKVVGRLHTWVTTLRELKLSSFYALEIQDDAESIHQLLRLLSDPSTDVKQNALTDLMKMARESSPSLWENQFKDILMSVVENMKDPEVCVIIGTFKGHDLRGYLSVLFNFGFVIRSQREIRWKRY